MLSQLFILILLSWIGEFLNKGVGIPVPGAILGMVLLTLLLTLGVVKLPRIEKGADALLSVLALFFVPFFVKLLDVGDILAEYGLKLIILLAVTTLVVMSVTALVAKLFLHLSHRRGQK